MGGAYTCTMRRRGFRHDGRQNRLQLSPCTGADVGSWALPGGFVNEDEPLDHAAARELKVGVPSAGQAIISSNLHNDTIAYCSWPSRERSA